MQIRVNTDLFSTAYFLRPLPLPTLRTAPPCIYTYPCISVSLTTNSSLGHLRIQAIAAFSPQPQAMQEKEEGEVGAERGKGEGKMEGEYSQEDERGHDGSEGDADHGSADSATASKDKSDGSRVGRSVCPYHPPGGDTEASACPPHHNNNSNINNNVGDDDKNDDDDDDKNDDDANANDEDAGLYPFVSSPFFRSREQCLAMSLGGRYENTVRQCTETRQQ